MYTAFLVRGHGGRLSFDTAAHGDTLDDCLAELRTYWGEGGAEPQHYVVEDPRGSVVAMVASGVDPEECLTLTRNGLDRHHCRYVLRPDGTYLRTDVTPGTPVPFGWA